MYNDTIKVKDTKETIYDIITKFDLPVLEYNPMNVNLHYANSVQPKAKPTSTAWQWHQRLGHCSPAVINQLSKQGEISIVTGTVAPTTSKCETCATLKMYQIISRTPVRKATKPFMRLYFDLIFVETAFDGTTCIGHFRDKFLGWNWVFPLLDHKEKTLIGLFKQVILEYEKLGIPISAFILVVHIDQEMSVGNRL